MEPKHENFIRISSNRMNKLIDMIRSFKNFANTSFYEFSDEEIDEMLEKIEKELDSTKSVLKSVNDSKTKKKEL